MEANTLSFNSNYLIILEQESVNEAELQARLCNHVLHMRPCANDLHLCCMCSMHLKAITRVRRTLKLPPIFQHIRTLNVLDFVPIVGTGNTHKYFENCLDKLGSLLVRIKSLRGKVLKKFNS